MKRENAESEAGSLAALVESVTALAEHARRHGPAPDCAERMEDLVARHRARIEAARGDDRPSSAAE